MYFVQNFVLVTFVFVEGRLMSSGTCLWWHLICEGDLEWWPTPSWGLVVPDAAITDVVGFSEEVVLLTRTDKCVCVFFLFCFCSSLFFLPQWHVATRN